MQEIKRQLKDIYHDRNTQLHGSLNPSWQGLLLPCRPLVPRNRNLLIHGWICALRRGRRGPLTNLPINNKKHPQIPQAHEGQQP